MQKLLIVGLGNPGLQYSFNRHNIGFMVLDALANEFNLEFSETRNFKSCIASNQKIILCKPTTYMNASGEAVALIKNYFKIKEFLVVHDDLDLSFGDLRFKRGGGNGGHNGLKSIDFHCGFDYWRARCGVGRPEEKCDVASYVLSDFESKPRELIKQCVDALKFFVQTGNFQEMQNRFTKKAKQ